MFGFKFQSDSINTAAATGSTATLGNFKFQSDSINTYTTPKQVAAWLSFKFQSDSINTAKIAVTLIVRSMAFKFQSDSINTPCSKTPLKPQVTTLISVDLRNKHLYALTS